MPRTRGFDSAKWSNEPGTESGDGSWSLLDNSVLTVRADSTRDYWRKTYYTPLLIKDDGPCFVVEVPLAEDKFTVCTTMQLYPVKQFDQGGIFIRYDFEHWIKAGIEFVDFLGSCVPCSRSRFLVCGMAYVLFLANNGTPRLSCVITNEYSDWSTQPWYGPTGNDIKIRLKMHKVGSSFIFEASSAEKDDWSFVRIAHLGLPATCEVEGHIQAGVYACCPIEQAGCVATFSEFSLRQGSEFEHSAGDCK